MGSIAHVYENRAFTEAEFDALEPYIWVSHAHTPTLYYQKKTNRLTFFTVAILNTTHRGYEVHTRKDTEDTPPWTSHNPFTSLDEAMAFAVAVTRL